MCFYYVDIQKWAEKKPVAIVMNLKQDFDWKMAKFCEKELIVGCTITFCILKQGHGGDCVFADPDIHK